MIFLCHTFPLNRFIRVLSTFTVFREAAVFTADRSLIITMFQRYVGYTKELYKRDLKSFFSSLMKEFDKIANADRKSSSSSKNSVIYLLKCFCGGLIPNGESP